MKLKRLWIDSFKNLNDFKLDFTDKEGITVLIGNNGSGKSNILEAISAIFLSLFEDNLKNLNFKFEIEYNINNLDIMISKKRTVRYQTKGENANNYNDRDKNKIEVPSQVIALYSGEELRLFKNYYEKFYLEYNKNVINNKIDIESKQKMLYINKYYWDIALLTFFASDMSIDDIIENSELESIQIKFNLKNLKKFINSNEEKDKKTKKLNEVIFFVGSLSKEKDSIDINLDDFKIASNNETYERLFKLLSVAYLPKDDNYKLITDIKLKFKNGLTTKEFSEGEKKKILLKLVLHILADEHTLILFDEPDSHIHVASKKQIKNLLEEYNRETILTTHSPTLTHLFNSENIVMLDNGKVENRQKQDIISKLTNDIWNYQEQNSFISSNKYINLIVEGKLDKEHIEIAIKKLSDEYRGLEFNIFEAGGCDKQKKLFDGLTNTNEIGLENKKIIFIFDNEKQFIDDETEKLKSKELQGSSKKKKNIYIKNNIYLIFLPKKDNFKNNFTIENMYPPEKFQNSLNKVFDSKKNNIDYFNDFIDEISNGIKEGAKNQLVKDCITFDKLDFEHFKVLFDLILKIKNNEI